MTWPLFSKTSTDMSADLVLFNQTRETLSAKTATLSIQHTCRVESCYVAAAATYMPSGLMLLSQTLLLFEFEHAYWLSAAANQMLAGLLPFNQHACRFFHSILHVSWRGCLLDWMLAGLLPFNQHACNSFFTQYCMSPGVELLFLLYLLVWCLTISRVCWYGVSLSAVSAGMVSHYQPCLLMW